jgi:hypothetical protein
MFRWSKPRDLKSRRRSIFWARVEATIALGILGVIIHAGGLLVAQHAQAGERSADQAGDYGPLRDLVFERNEQAGIDGVGAIPFGQIDVVALGEKAHSQSAQVSERPSCARELGPMDVGPPAGWLKVYAASSGVSTMTIMAEGPLRNPHHDIDHDSMR